MDAQDAVNMAVEATRHRPGMGPQGDNLGPHDFVGTTFFIACNAMFAFGLYFVLERQSVSKQWQQSVTVAALVCLVAWYNYTFMRDAWVHTQTSPTTYRYTDWLITVPLQIQEFYLVLKAAGPAPESLGTRLLIASLIMLGAGWLGETDVMQKAVAFAVGMAGWLYIVYEVQAGEAAQLSQKLGSKASQSAFATIRTIVTYGWTIYPLGYVISYLIPATAGAYASEMALNVTYNLADVVNKGAFGLAVLNAAKMDNNNPLMG